MIQTPGGFMWINWYWDITVTSHECHDVSDHWQCDCLINSLFSDQHRSPTLLALCGKSTWNRWIPCTKRQQCGRHFHAITWSWTVDFSWWCHQMETFSVWLAICAGNSLVTGEFPAQRPVTRSFDVFFDLLLNKQLSKQWWDWWFQMPSRSFYDVTVMWMRVTHEVSFVSYQYNQYPKLINVCNIALS